jgi:ABC-type antimicrobial peptide transport system permease subunit
VASFTMIGNWRQMQVAVSILMIGTGVVAYVLPVRRALRIQPIQALRD